MMIDYTGQQIGNYRLVRRLGMGGFASVYLGQHVRIATQQAAIKLLHLFGVDTKKFQQEAETTAALDHPNIIRLFDFDFHDQMPFLVIEYAPGGSLRTRHPKETQVPLPTIVQYVQQIAEALEYAHGKNIIHRDIKPDNILISAQGELRLSDFGIAIMSQTGRTSLDASAGIGGTAYYMAPEQSRGEPKKASDQYALGIMAYEWLCGKPPFTEGNVINIQYQHAHKPVPPLREQLPMLSPAIEQAVLCALAKDPQERFANVKAFAQTLEAACYDTPSSIHLSRHIQPSPVTTPRVPSAGSSKIQVSDSIELSSSPKAIDSQPIAKQSPMPSGDLAASSTRPLATPMPYTSSQRNTEKTTVATSAAATTSVTRDISVGRSRVHRGSLAQAGVSYGKRRWGVFMVVAILLIGSGMIISMSSWHLFQFGQPPGSNAILVTVTNSHTSSTSTSIASHNGVNKIADVAGILDQNQVRSAGASLRYPLDIYTTHNFLGTSNQFEQRARSHLTNANMIVMAISTSPSYVTVVAGSAVPLSNAEANSVISSFRNSYQSSGGDFTFATVSALQALQHALASGSAG